jgi:hypothetical protein
MRRFTRLTNGFFKKGRELGSGSGALLHALQLLPDSPNASRHLSNGSGISDHVWSLAEVISLLR